MSFEDILPHTCTVYRPDGETDRFGQPYEAFDPDHRTSVGTFPCRLSTARKGGQVLDNGESKWVFHVTHRLFAAPGADCAENDLVLITTASGATLLPLSQVRLRKDVFDSESHHHTEFELEVQRGPSSGV